ncbi:MAG: glycosyltransferase, partial [Selenomonadaceae bacterium]|nr:glycosyltransferase [Selenomonadaceae bacterium]
MTSILNQTFQNFEVIVVDDCSTDKSCDVVESFIPKFGGRLKLLHMKKNSGGAGKPSNKGIANSIGKYLFIMDNDDLIFKSTLEVLYTTAEHFDVDMIYMEQGFTFSGNEDKLFPDSSDLKGRGWQGRGPFVDKPIQDSNNINERIEVFLQSRMGWPVWEKFFKRTLITENDITFPNLKASQDIIFTIELISHAKKILRVPYPLYVYRLNNPNSICATERNNAEKLAFWADINLQGIKFLTNFFSEQKFFNDNPKYKWALLN